jgi:predicted Zn finger-like uncharacterized protein
MKIVCDSCQAKYSIADEKVQGKAFKIRCKKCNHIIVVRSGGAPAADAAAEPKPAPVEAQGTWYIVVEGEQVGPLAESDIAARLARGEITGETLVWKEGLADWMQLSAVPELAQASSPQATSARSRPRSRRQNLRRSGATRHACGRMALPRRRRGQRLRERISSPNQPRRPAAQPIFSRRRRARFRPLRAIRRLRIVGVFVWCSRCRVP